MINRLMSLAKTYRPYDGSSGAYVSVTPDSMSQGVIARWASHLGLPLNDDRQEDLHSTIIWSTTPVTDLTCEPLKLHGAELDHFEYWGGHDNDGYVTAVLRSQALRGLHQKWLDRGATHRFPDYLPHVTLASKIRPTPGLRARMLVASSAFVGQRLVFSKESLENAK